MSRVKAGKRTEKFEDKMDGRKMLAECWRKKKKNMEKKEREKYYGTPTPVKKWKDLRKMDECRAE
jgi:hypothetical protein